MSATIDAVVKRLTSQAHANATTLRKEEHGPQPLRTLAEQRMSKIKETLTGDDRVRKIMGDKPAETPHTHTQVRQRLVTTRCAARGTRPPKGPWCPIARTGSAAVAAFLNV